jgi:beta-glucosidase
MSLAIGLLPAITNAQQTEPLATNEPPSWRDAALAMDARVKDLVGRMTLEEKIGQMWNQAPAIRRLGLPAYNYWNECLHGVARNGTATVFPQAIGMAAAWDTNLLHDVADVIATEARAKNRQYTEAHNGDAAQYAGLTFWTPNINIFRDPRWGRGQETYGEDPFLTGRLAVSFIQGLQGSDPKYIKALACAKHFAVHSGPESDRHRFDAVPSERDFYETYLPHFEMAVREGHVGAVMGAYNAVYGEPACCNTLLLSNILRGQWGFTGQVVSDCGAIKDIYTFHKFVPTAAEAAALSVRAGCDLSCLADYRGLSRALGSNWITEAEIDTAVGRVLKARFQLGLFDPPEQVPYARIATNFYDTPEHGQLALKLARESIVLLKNSGVLPLNRAKLKRIAVVGPNATSVPMLLGNYNGMPTHPVTILDGIKAVAGTNIEVVHELGGPLALRVNDTNQAGRAEAQSRAVAAAIAADIVIYVGGLSPELEGEEMRVPFDGFGGGDRTRIELPTVQTDLLKALRATGKPVVFVNCSGSAVAIPWEAENLPTIVQAWYPGQAGGTAVAEILFGDVNPSGRLPVTFYHASSDLPAFTNYSMSNRTYRFFTGKPLFAFGHGLSYARFQYKSVKADHSQAAASNIVRVNLEVANSDARDGDEVVQVYFRHVDSQNPQPRQALCGFRRVTVQHGKSSSVQIDVPISQFRYWDTAKKQYAVEPGKYELLVGSSSDDIRARIPLRVVAQK